MTYLLTVLSMFNYYYLYYCTLIAINSSYQLNYCISIKSSVSTETARLYWLTVVIDVDFIKPRIVYNY